MSKKESVVVTIDEVGGVTVGAEGVSGPDCAGFTKAMESALGETVDDIKTKEYNQRASVGVSSTNTVKAGG